MVNILSETNSVFNNFISELRDKTIQTEKMRFRKNMERIGQLMAYELSKTMNYRMIEVETPLGTSEVQIMSDSIVLIPILRAALPLYNGLLSVFDNSESGFVGAFREEGKEIKINFGYLAAPDITDKVLILIDPMLATGKSQIVTLENLERHGKPSHIHLVSVVAAPEGIEFINSELAGRSFTIWTVAKDERLNDDKYIVPGLGDAGDLSFGPKL
ncbi:MAG TPA: uracil phosphoribosyltransferase [Cyclobacteriaceae bacterium]|jgi:uracil phosphoribosyltransferase